MWPRGCQLSMLSPLDWSKLTHFPILRVPCALSPSLSIPLQLSLAPVVFHSVFFSITIRRRMHHVFVCMIYVSVRGHFPSFPPCPVSPSSPPLSGKVRNTLRNVLINNPHYSVMHFHQPLLLLPVPCLNAEQRAAASYFH